MKKREISVKPLIYFISFVIGLILISIIGIKNINALVIDSQFLGNNINQNFGVSTGEYISGNSYITVDQSNALNYYVVDICTTLNYGFEISNVYSVSGSVSLYKVYKHLGSCNTTSYDGQLARIYFKINEWTDAGNGNFGIIFNSRFENTTTYYGDNRILNIYTSNEIDNTNEIINNQTNEINDTIKNSEDNIINNQNQNTEDMIQSQVACSFIDKTNIKTDNYYLNGSGGEVSGNNFGITDYINVLGGKLKLLQIDEYNAYACFYNVNKEIISCTATNSLALGEMTIPANANYARFTINKSTNKPTFELCRNGNQAIVDSQNQMNDKLDGIQGALTDNSTPNLDSLENSIGWLPPGPVDSILNLSLTMLNSLTNSLTKTCAPLNITLPYVNKNIQIPCLSAIFAQINGVNTLWTWVGSIASVLILYSYLLNLYAWIDRVLTLRAEFDEAMGADLANWGRL